MAIIKLVDSGYQLIPIGWHTFCVVEANYNEDFGKLEVTLQNKEGQKHIEKFSLMDVNGEPNEGAYRAFSYFAKTCLNDYSITSVDEQDLVGKYIRAEVKHVEGTKINARTGKKYVNANLGDKEPAFGFDDALEKKGYGLSNDEEFLDFI